MNIKILSISALLLSAIGMQVAQGQETARERLSRQRASTSADASTHGNVRAEQANRGSAHHADNAKWSRIVYRYLDLSKEPNAPLYFPAAPSDGRMNLFSMIFKLLQNNQIKAYEYLDGREVFTDDYVMDFPEFLNRYGIFHETAGGQISVDDTDIPSNEVLGYFVKEAYYFETVTSNFGIVPLAICPVMQRQGDYDAGTTRYPLFWIPYEEIRPYAMRMPVMTSSINNAMTGTIDDFFRKRNYWGEIYKTMNLRNLAISQYTSTPEEAKAEQEKIERELKTFEENLWKKDTEFAPAASSPQTKRNRRSGTSSATTSTMRDRRY